MATYEARSKTNLNLAAKELLRTIAEKKSNLCVSVDVTLKDDLLAVVDAVGPFVALIKVHFDWDVIKQLSELAVKHNFLIFEDRKFADIGNTVSLQYAAGMHRIVQWSHLTNAHLIPGPGVISGLGSVGLPLQRGLLLIAEMSTQGSLTKDAYTTANVQAAMEDTSNFVMGFIAMHRVHKDPAHISPKATEAQRNKDFLILTPGVGLDATGDGKGQQYRTPDQVIRENDCDMIIVGRGVYGPLLDQSSARDDALKQVRDQAERYRSAGWDAYLAKMGTTRRRAARHALPTPPQTPIKRAKHTLVKHEPDSPSRGAMPLKKIKMELTEEEQGKIRVPKHWEEVHACLAKMREETVAPVDTMGCVENGLETNRADRGRLGPDGAEESKEDALQRYEYTTLVSLMLSSQTKDTVTALAVYNLQRTLPNGVTVDSVRGASDDVLRECICKVGFFRRKTEYIRKTADILAEKHGGQVPKTIDELCALPGVGPKMAFLQMQAMGFNVGIGVDTHVHRIANRLGWCKTKTPEQTRLALQSWLPKHLFRQINKQMVGFGQVICVPIGPRCDVCTIGQRRLCPSRQRVEQNSIAKRAPIYYRDGTVLVGNKRVTLHAFKQEALDTSDQEMIDTVVKTEQVLEW
ncbi:Ntg2p [Malassezia vespertilionis]|uniref:Endonuclease III homolog n=1 Tax=Malassezia vespertilionis TaxID=2020962 RepID=A0A2N1J8R3_9BASI|nr:Ntg2p [Malassezia vespertilionis]